MREIETISEEMLNAYIDNELEDQERLLVIHALKENAELANTVNQMRQIDDLMNVAYKKEYLPKGRVYKHRSASTPWLYASAAAVVFLFIGVTVGTWLLPANTDSSLPFKQTSEFSPNNPKDNHILIHVSNMDQDQVNRALTKAEEILRYKKANHDPVNIKFIANAEGLSLLRRDSPFAGRIQRIHQQYQNIEFLACGIAMENARLKEQHEITLLPEARKIPAALTEILDGLKAGWVYVKP